MTLMTVSSFSFRVFIFVGVVARERASWFRFPLYPRLPFSVYKRFGKAFNISLFPNFTLCVLESSKGIWLRVTDEMRASQFVGRVSSAPLRNPLRLSSQRVNPAALLADQTRLLSGSEALQDIWERAGTFETDELLDYPVEQVRHPNRISRGVIGCRKGTVGG